MAKLSSHRTSGKNENMVRQGGHRLAPPINLSDTKSHAEPSDILKVTPNLSCSPIFGLSLSLLLGAMLRMQGNDANSKNIFIFFGWGYDV
jgi:hypothetical protein